MMDAVAALEGRAQAARGRARAELLSQAALAAWLHHHDAPGALARYRAALEASPGFLPAQEGALALLEDPAARLAGALDEALLGALGEGAVDALCARAEARLDGDPEGAAQDLEAALARDPGCARARLLLPEALTRLGDLEALSQAAQAEAAATRDEGARACALRLAGLIQAEVRGDAAQGASLLRQSREWAPLHPSTEAALGRLAAGQGGAALAEHWRRACRRLPDGPARVAAAMEAAVAVALHEESPAEALEILLEAVPEGVDAPRALQRAAFELGAALGAARHPEGSPELLRRLALLLESPARRAAIYTRLGQHLARGLEALDGIEAERALRYLEAALEAEPGYLPALETLEGCYEDGAASLQGRELLRMRAEEAGRPEAMLRAARMTLEGLGRPVEAWTLLRRAVALSTEADLMGPESALDLIERLPPEAGDPRVLLEEARGRAPGAAAQQRLLELSLRASLGLGDEGAVMQALVALIELLPEERFYVEALAAMYHRVGARPLLEDMRRAEVHHAEGRDPARALDAQTSLARLAQLRGDDEEALRWYEAALLQRPGDLAAVVGAGRILVRQERWAELALVFEAELAVAGSDADTASLAFRCATLYERHLGDLGRAWESYALVRQLNPHHLPSLLGMIRVAGLRQDWPAWARLVEEWAQRERDDSLSGTLSCELAQAQEDRLGDLEGAARSFRRALERAPRLELARLGLARCLTRLGRPDEAAEAVLGGLAELDTPVERLDLLATALLLSPDELAATGALLREFPEHAPSLLAATRAALERHALPQAAAHARALRAVLVPGPVQEGVARLGALLERLCGPEDPQQPPPEGAHEGAWLLHEVALRREGRWGALAELLRRRAHQSLPLDQRAAWLCAAARALRLQGDPRGARALYEEALGAAPEHLGALKALRLLLEEGGDRDLLARLCEREGLLTADPALAVTLLLRAAELRRRHLNDLDGACLSYEAVLARQPDHEGAFNALREIYPMRGDYEALCALLERRADHLQDPEEAHRLLMLCGQVALDRLRDHRRAVRAYRRVLDFDPNYIQVWRILAQLARDDLRWRDAIEALTHVLQLTQDDSLLAHIHQDIASIQENELGDVVGAIASYHALLRYDPDRVSALRRLALLLQREQRWEESARVYGKLLQREKDRRKLIADLRALAEICVYGLQDPERAEQCLTQGLRLDPLDLDLHRLLIEQLSARGLTERRVAHLTLASRQFASAFLLHLPRPPQRDAALEGLLQLALWQQDPDRAYVLGAIARHLQIDSAPLGEAYASGALRGQPTGRLAPIPVDKTDATLPSELLLSFLHLLRFGDEALRRQHRPAALKDALLGRKTLLRDRDGRPGATLALLWPALFSLPDLPVHVVPFELDAPCVMTGEELGLVLSEGWLARMGRGEGAALFAVGEALAPLSMGVLGYATLEPELRLPAVAALVRRAAPAWLASDERATHPLMPAERLLKAIRVPDATLLPHALDLSGRLDRAGVLAQEQLLWRATRRLAITPVYAIDAVLAAVHERRGEPEVMDLLRFLVGERAAELRAAVLPLQ